MSSASSNEYPASALPRNDTFTRSRRSAAPSPSARAPAHARIHHPQEHLNTLLAEEYKTLSPALREMLRLPETFAPEAPIPTVEGVDEPQSDFYDSPIIRERVMRNRARLDLINKGGPAAGVHTPELTAAQLSGLHGRLRAGRAPMPSMAPSAHAGVSGGGRPIHSPRGPLRVPRVHSIINMAQRRTPGYSDGIGNSYPSAAARDPHVSHNDGPDLLKLRRGFQQTEQAARIRRFREEDDARRHHPRSSRRPLTYKYDPKSPTFTPSQYPMISDDVWLEDHMEAWEIGYKLGVQRGEGHYSPGYLIESFFETTHLRIFLLGLAFLAYGMLCCEKWEDVGLQFVLGVNFLMQARE